jgi:predicted nucleic acid-binding protein
VKLVLDASVAVKLVTPEPEQEQALAMLKAHPERIAPELLLVEVANTLWKKVMRGELAAAYAPPALEVVEDAITRFVPDALLAADALKLSMELNHPTYDCLYLALAQREQATIVTADKRLLNRLGPTRLAGVVRPLSQVN